MKLAIDGRAVEVAAGATVLDAVNQLGLPLPQLCKDPDRPPLGACRTCLVHVEGQRGAPAACHLPAREGMVVSTTHPEVVRLRATVLELTRAMLSEGEGRAGFGQVGEACARHSVAPPQWQPLHRFAVDASQSFFVLDREACILCGRCTVACDDVQHIGAIAMLGRGHQMKVGVFGDGLLASSVCTSCGQCVATCPTGALRPRESPATLTRQVETTCPYCGVGCGIVAGVRGGTGEDERLALMADDVPANASSQGMLCVKGRFGTGFIHARDRVTTPRVKRDGRWREASWEEALEAAAEGLARHRGRFAALASAKATNEDGYVVQKFVRVIMGSNNIDHCTRLCHSPSVEAMLVSMGSGATSNSYVDYEEAGCLLIVGADASANHPVIAIRFRRAMRRGARIIVINPKRIDLCDQADLWIAHRPGTDVTLFNAMARVILDEGLANDEFIRARTEGFEAWAASLEPFTLAHAAQVTGVPADDIRQAARWYARPFDEDARRAGSCLVWGMGITQHVNGLHNAHALLNLSLVTGQLGFRGAGISPLRGQNNVQGCGDAGCIPTSLPGYQPYDAPTLERFERAWGARPPDQVGLVVTEMIDRCLSGDVRAMYVVGENPLLSEPDLHHAEKALGQLECLVVQDLFLHETAERAHVFLPAAAFAEKEGTFTNSERRVQRVRQALPPPGQARPDWWITAELAKRVGHRLGVGLDQQFSYSGAAEIFDEMARLTPFLGGLSHARLDREGGLQWPCPTSDHPGTRFLYADRFPRGKGCFVPALQTREAAELPDEDYPLLLNTGRLLYHWHGGTISRRVPGLVALAPRLEVTIHPADAASLGIADGVPVRVVSRRGELTGWSRLTDAVRPGAIFVPFVKLQDSAANFLTNSALDPGSKIPEYKVCAVRVEPVGQSAASRR
jgi:formate dehydrogenase alpha subunit